MGKGTLIEFTTEQLLNAVKDSGGIYTTIATRLQVAWHTAKRLVESDPEALQAYIDEGEKILDVAESAAYRAVKDGDSAMIKYILNTKGRKRGFAEKQIIEHEGSVSHKLNLEGLSTDELAELDKLASKITDKE